MESESIFQVEEVKPCPFDESPIASCSRGNKFAFINSNKQIFCYDSSSLKKKEMLPPEKNVNGNPIHLGISLDQKYLCVAYDDGNLQYYDLAENSKSKSISNVKSAITALSFLNNDTIIYADNTKQLYCAKIVSTLFRSADQKIPIKVTSEIKSIQIPEIYRFETTNKGNAASCKYPELANIVALITDNEVLIIKLGGKEPEVIFNTTISNAVFSFDQPSNNSINFLIATQKQIEIFKYSGENGVNSIYSTQNGVQPIFATSLSPVIMCVITEDQKMKFISSTDDSATEHPCPKEAIGDMHAEKYVITVFGQNRLYKISLLSFDAEIELLMDENNYKGIIAFCRRALAGDQSAIVGLPPDQGFRLLLIEQSLTNSLRGDIQNKLEDKSKAPEVIKELIDMWKELNLRSEIVGTSIINIFAYENLLPVYFNAIMEEDPDASHFLYSRDFVEHLLNTPEVHNAKFIMSLSMKIAPTIDLLRYAIKNQKNDLLKDVYLLRQDQPLNAIRILANNNEYGLVRDVFDEIISNSKETTHREAPLCVKWLLATNKGFHFPRLTGIISSENENKTLEVINKLDNYIEKTRKSGITSVQFANFLIIAIGESNLSTDGPIYQHTDELLLKLAGKQGERATIVYTTEEEEIEEEEDEDEQTHAYLMPEAAAVIVRRLFRPFSETDPHDREDRQTMVDLLINFEFPKPFYDALAPLCEVVGFHKETQMLRTKAGRYDVAIQEAIASPENCFTNISNIIELRKDNKNLMKDDIINSSPLLIARDIESFVRLILRYFPDDAFSILKALADKNMQNYYMHELMLQIHSGKSQESIKKIRMPFERAEQYLTFICQYFPSEARSFISEIASQPGSDISNLLHIVEKYQVYDAIALIDLTLHDLVKFKANITRFFAMSLVKFVKDVISKIECEESVEFTTTLIMNLSKEKGRSAFVKPLAEDIVKAFAAPMYLVVTSNADQEKQAALESLMKSTCIKLSDITPFDSMIQTIVGTFYELPLSCVRRTILELVKDYSYDIDAATALSMLISENRSDAYNKFVMELLKGTKFEGTSCSTCHGKLSDTNRVLLFKCGHAFHDEPSCCPKDTCPICVPGILLSDKAARSANMPKQAPVNRKMKIFEQKIANIGQDDDRRYFSNQNIASIEIKGMDYLP